MKVKVTYVEGADLPWRCRYRKIQVASRTEAGMFLMLSRIIGRREAREAKQSQGCS